MSERKGGFSGKIKVEIGKTVLFFESSSDSFKSWFDGNSVLTQIPEKCICGSNNIFLNLRKPQGGKYTYRELRCGECKRFRQFGEFKDGSGLFLKPNWESFEGN